MNLHLFSSELVICQCKIFMTVAGDMHDTGYVYSIWSTEYHFPFGYLHLSIFICPSFDGRIMVCRMFVALSTILARFEPQWVFISL